MGALYLLLPISLILVIVIGVAFWWAIFAGQFDDTDAAARSILDDDDSTGPSPDDSPQGRK
ncbi:MAG: cbb3-type cytochrome oxidase assembly protein CcoS [Pusillimonas sp.]